MAIKYLNFHVQVLYFGQIHIFSAMKILEIHKNIGMVVLLPIITVL